MKNALLDTTTKELDQIIDKASGHKKMRTKYAEYPENPTEFIRFLFKNHAAVRGLIEEQIRRRKELQAIEIEVKHF